MPPQLFILSAFAVLAFAIWYRAPGNAQQIVRNGAHANAIRVKEARKSLKSKSEGPPFSWLNRPRPGRPLLVVSLDVLLGTMDRWTTVLVRPQLEHFLSLIGEHYDLAIWMPSSNINRLDEILRKGGEATRLSDYIVLAIDHSSIATFEGGHERYEYSQQAGKPLALIWRQPQHWNASNTILCADEQQERNLIRTRSVDHGSRETIYDGNLSPADAFKPGQPDTDDLTDLADHLVSVAQAPDFQKVTLLRSGWTAPPSAVEVKDKSLDFSEKSHWR